MVEKITLSVVGVFLVSLFFTASCGKKKEDLPSAVITVNDSLTGNPLDSVKVRLHLDKTMSVVSGSAAVPPDPSTKITDSYGQVKWTIKNPASFFAEITSDFSLDTAKKLILFKKNELNSVTVLY